MEDGSARHGWKGDFTLRRKIDRSHECALNER